MTDYINVRYTGNADPRSGSGAINGLPGRSDILMGHTGQLTSEEYGMLASRGCQFEIVTPEDLASPATHDHGGGIVHQHALNFSSMLVADLQDLAYTHSLDVEGTGSNGTITKTDLVDALDAAHV